MPRLAENPLQIWITGSYILLNRALEALVASLPGLAPYQEAHPDSNPAPPPDLILHILASPDNLQSFNDHQKSHPDQRVLLFALTWTTTQVRAALQAGAVGCLTANMPVEAFAASLRQAARGEIALASSLQQALILELSQGVAPDQSPAITFSSRETDVLTLLVEGLSNKEIAQRLYLSVRTIENHLARIYGKIGVSSRTEAAIRALKNGWVQSN